jgi:hypothetical protein
MEIRRRILSAAAIQQVDKILKAAPPPDAAIAAKMAELDIENRMVQMKGSELGLKAEELSIRGAREEADLAIRRGKDKAIEIRELSQAILNLANARKADSEVDQGWYDVHLTALRHQIDLININSAVGDAGSNPSAAAGNTVPTPGTPGGPQGIGLPGMAPPPGLAGSAGVPGGLSG